MSDRDDPNDWIRHTHLTEEQRRCCWRRSQGSRIVASVALIAVGVLLFLGNLGILPIHTIWVLWPCFPIVFGITGLLNARDARARVWGLLLVLFGSFFLMLNFGWIRVQTHDGSWVLSLILIAVGCAALFGVLDPSRRSRPLGQPFRAHSGPPDYQNTVNDFTILGGLKRKVESSDFQGGDLTTIFGSIEMDLRHTAIALANKSVILNVVTIFGATKIRVHPNWKVHATGAGILGTFEDKTVPPNTGIEAPTLIITGFSVFGSVEVED